VEATPPVRSLLAVPPAKPELFTAVDEARRAAPVRASAARVVSTEALVLFEALTGVYSWLGFDAVGDEVFRDLVIARVVEPTSLLDTARVLTDLGRAPASYATMKRTLARAVATATCDTTTAGLSAGAAATDTTAGAEARAEVVAGGDAAAQAGTGSDCCSDQAARMSGGVHDSGQFTPGDFTIDERASTVTCPAGTTATIEGSEQVIPRNGCPSIDLHPEDVRA
jgi:hypothetical protein